MISYSYHVCIKIKFIPPLCLSLTSGGGGDCEKKNDYYNKAHS